MTANAADRLIQHYVDNSRVLPWRSPPGAPPPDPYVVWLSEIMLQQTTVAAVIPRFRRFLERWPTITALASASDSEILSEWAGLGYYARARNLIVCAREVAERGNFPTTSIELRNLRGVGAYTSAAIAAIAFGEAAPAVDTNVQRVIARLAGLTQPSRRDIERRVSAMMRNHAPGDIVQALMDLGATICRARQPLCGDCPLRTVCKASECDPERFPKPRQRKARPHRFGVAFWIERTGQVWLVRRPSSGILGGMAALPGGDWTDEIPASNARLGKVRHVFTHFSLDLFVDARTEPDGEGWWHPIESIGEAGLPTLYLKAARQALRQRASLAA